MPRFLHEWATCKHSRSAVNRAGATLIDIKTASDDEIFNAVLVMDQWRASHNYPLHIVANSLAARARRVIGSHALTARRIKRLRSIRLKLLNNPSMRLTQMQDMGGCRAVLKNMREVDKLVKYYEDAMVKHPEKSDRPFVHLKDDYIKDPKPDGYRSVHLIMKYQSRAKQEFNDQQIEIQIRTALQHAWATSVEVCEVFTGHALKSKYKTDKVELLRFFSLMSSAIAERERCAIVPDTPKIKRERKAELKRLEEKLNLVWLLQSWGAMATFDPGTDMPEAKLFLLRLDASKKSLLITPYSESQMDKAHEDYAAEERAFDKYDDMQIVLVSTDSIGNLRRAYPNYYGDTREFMEAIKQEIY